MKRGGFIVFCGLLSMAIYAQDWTIDANINIYFYDYYSETSRFSLNLNFGKYLSNNINIGLRAGFGIGKDEGNSFTVGPYFKYDFLKFDKAYFALTTGIYYTRYNESYSLSGRTVDANRIVVLVAPSITYMFNNNIEVYWQLGSIRYRYDWGPEHYNTVKEFQIQGILTNPTFGLIIKFGPSGNRLYAMENTNISSAKNNIGNIDNNVFENENNPQRQSRERNQSRESRQSTESVPIPQLGEPDLIQQALNKLPAIPIAGNNLKFQFGGDIWIATVNGENFSAGTIEIEDTIDGSILTLKQTHIWPGAVGRTAGRIASRIPGGAAVGGALNTAGRIAGTVGAIEAIGPEIILEYKADPRPSLRLYSSK